MFETLYAPVFLYSTRNRLELIKLKQGISVRYHNHLCYLQYYCRYTHIITVIQTFHLSHIHYNVSQNINLYQLPWLRYLQIREHALQYILILYRTYNITILFRLHNLHNQQRVPSHYNRMVCKSKHGIQYGSSIITVSQQNNIITVGWNLLLFNPITRLLSFE